MRKVGTDAIFQKKRKKCVFQYQLDTWRETRKIKFINSLDDNDLFDSPILGKIKIKKEEESSESESD